MKRCLAILLIPATLFAGCETFRPTGLTDVLARPAERALFTGWRAYDNGQYADAERELKAALSAGLQSESDRATARKLLAFIYCTSNRLSECERAFRSAREADQSFALTRAEAGHPLWGPVYRKVVP